MVFLLVAVVQLTVLVLVGVLVKDRVDVLVRFDDDEEIVLESSVFVEPVVDSVFVLVSPVSLVSLEIIFVVLVLVIVERVVLVSTSGHFISCMMMLCNLREQLFRRGSVAVNIKVMSMTFEVN